jgi:hypothetical protein
MSFSLKVKRVAQRPNLERFTAKLYSNMIHQFNAGAKEFAEAMITEVGKHIDTGMSIGSTVPMARLVKSMMANSSVGFQHAKRGYTDIDGNYVNAWKSWGAGVRLGRNAFSLFYGSQIRPVFKLHYDYAIFQHMIHDAGYQTPAWKSVLKASAAFRLFFMFSKARVSPRLADYMEIYETVG